MIKIDRVIAMALAIFVLLSTTSAYAQELVWEFSPVTGNYYAATPLGLTWEEAQMAAEAEGGHLVAINSAAENEWVWETFSPLENHWWLGFTDQAEEGVWVWTSGESATYTNWQPGEPNNLGTGQHFGVMDFRSGDWDDEDNERSADRFGVIERTEEVVPTDDSSWGGLKASVDR